MTRSLLVLGGTTFVGRAVVDAALDRGVQVTTLNRSGGSHRAEVETLRGDRTAAGGLDPLRGREWDAVVDTWSLAPWVVRDSARLLADSVGHYGYISSRSVYVQPIAMGADESAPLVAGAPAAVETDYAADKRGGEIAVVEAFGDRSMLARAGLILGPRENVGRLPWWLQRIARGGDVLAPGPSGLPLQYVDARDLAAFVLDAGEQGLSGPFNTVSPQGHTTMGGLLEACVAATGADAQLRWVDGDWLLAQDVGPWVELPVWIPASVEDYAMHAGDTAKAAAAGLHCRPVEETVRDTWEWVRTLDGPAPTSSRGGRVGMDPDRERALLARAAADGALSG